MLLIVFASFNNFSDVSETQISLTLTTLESSDVGVVMIATKSPDDKLELRIDYDAFANVGINRYIFRLPSSADERVWGGGEQFTYLNLRKGGRYPLWVREQVNNS